VKEVNGHILEIEPPGSSSYYRCKICGLIAFKARRWKNASLSANDNPYKSGWIVSERSMIQQPLEDMSCADFMIKEIIE